MKGSTDSGRMREDQNGERKGITSEHHRPKTVGSTDKTMLVGDSLCEKNSLPAEVITIVEGEMRLIGTDEDGEPITLKKYREGEIAGSDVLIRGEKGLCIRASRTTRGASQRSLDYLEDYCEKEDIERRHREVEPWELWAATTAGKSSNRLVGKELLHECEEFCKGSKAEVIQLKPGATSLIVENKIFLVSTSNLEGWETGDVIRQDCEIVINGRRPGRIIEITEDWPPAHVDPTIRENRNALSENKGEKENEELSHKQALEDWFGKQHKDNRHPYFHANGEKQAALCCLRMLARANDLPFRSDLIRRILEEQFKKSNGKRASIETYAAMCNLIGLRSSWLKPDSANLIDRAPLPALGLLKDGPVVLWEAEKGKTLVGDPQKCQRWLKTEDLFIGSGENPISIICVERSSRAPISRFGLKWFIPAIKKHKGALAQVVVTSFFVQLLGLFNPLLIQQIIDAVISQGNFSSLHVLGTLLIAMAIAQALLGSLRTYMFSDTTNRIDISLGGEIINHLLKLPLSYFGRRSVGEVSSRIGELERIRGFLTGTALTALLDAAFSVIYIAIMLLYSVPLTLASLAVLPIFLGITSFVSPIIRDQLRQQAEANAKVQSHLVETLSGMETVKGQGMELTSEWRWEQLYGKKVAAGFRNTITSTAASSTNQFLGQASGLIVIWLGAILVLEGRLTLGQLIAFRILSGYVTTPLLRLGGLWQNFQQTALSLERLADIVDHQEEIELAGKELPPLPPIKGSVQYSKISFSFSKGQILNLANVSFEASSGSFIGVVGSSGSGKSTLLKMITRLFDPDEGQIRIDGHDISKVDLYSLRSQIGVVPQDSILFDGTIQENIALTRPESSFDEIRAAAKIACADGFIEDLPAGYSNRVGERGSALSGGQRQRLAIARMVLKHPKLLVLDEATSALDAETEELVTKNLAEEFKDRTVFFITHRLTSLRGADKILVMEKGVLVEEGTHSELLKLDGRYRSLYLKQGGESK